MTADPPADDETSAPSDEGAVARLKALSDSARERLAATIEAALSKVFDSPFDIRNTYEASQALNPSEHGGAGQGAMRRAAEWGAARAATRIGTRYGSKFAGRAVAPIGLAVEFGLSARDGIRELQVLTSFLVTRMRIEGHPADAELVRRTVLAVYLDPRRRPDLKVPLHRRSLAVAKQWSVNSLPLTGRRQTNQTQRRVAAIASIPLPDLMADWRRVRAVDTDVAPVAGRVIEARIADRVDRPADGPSDRPPPPPPPPPR